jgi:hypothetical protein
VAIHLGEVHDSQMLCNMQTLLEFDDLSTINAFFSEAFPVNKTKLRAEQIIFLIAKKEPSKYNETA